MSELIVDNILPLTYGSEKFVFIRAFGVFNSRSIISIINSGNISSIVDVSIGQYIPYFSNLAPYNSYAAYGGGQRNSGSGETSADYGLRDAQTSYIYLVIQDNDVDTLDDADYATFSIVHRGI